MEASLMFNIWYCSLVLKDSDYCCQEIYPSHRFNNQSPVKFFSKLNKFIFGYFNPVNIYFLIIKINIFRGDLSDISAKTATLPVTRACTSPAFGLFAVVGLFASSDFTDYVFVYNLK